MPVIDTGPVAGGARRQSSSARGSNACGGPATRSAPTSPAAAAVGGLPRIVVEADQREAEEEPISDVAVRNAPPWLVSTIFHMALLIILALIAVVTQVDGPVELTVVAEEEDEDFDDLGNPEDVDDSMGLEEDAVKVDVVTPQFLPEVQDPFAAPDPWDELLKDVNPVEDLDAPTIGFALRGREAGSKKGLLGKYGGTPGTQRAVKLGLAWLARQQLDDGSWSLTRPYSDGAYEMHENPVAATAMALLAFQGDGNTHLEGTHRRNVIRGWNWLIKQQDEHGNFFRSGPMNHPFYTHAQATIALCELLGMTEDEDYRQPARRAIDYLLESQSPQGGWKYQPRGRSDVSVTGWVVMALQSARMAGLEVPQENLDRVTEYLDSVAMYEGVRYPYERGDQPTLAMTAEAILCRQYLGWKQDDPRMVEALDWITEPGNLVDYGPARNTYYWYYATQVCHHMEGRHWKAWNDRMRVEVPKAQVQRGKERGSWNPDPNDRYEALAGRLYATCLSIYMMEVYYRHLPIYANVYDVLD